MAYTTNQGITEEPTKCTRFWGLWNFCTNRILRARIWRREENCASFFRVRGVQRVEQARMEVTRRRFYDNRAKTLNLGNNTKIYRLELFR